MRLLFVTQALDIDDPVLSVYHEWVRELALQVEEIQVICLKKGHYDLPNNVEVHSLGKEVGRQPAILYALRFLMLSWKLRNSYDRVLVHMNQEYLLLAGWMWLLLGKPAFLWRNHYAGSILTDSAAAFCRSVFCTSKNSYTAKYRKTVLMPVGVDTKRFTENGNVHREGASILFLARIAPSKRLDMFLDALGLLIQKGISFSASVYGSPLPKDVSYYKSMQTKAEALGLRNRVQFFEGVPNAEAPLLYQKHEFFVNCSPSGMLDKTIFEAAASGALPLAISEDWKSFTEGKLWFTDEKSLAARLETLLANSGLEAEKMRGVLEGVVEKHSLKALGNALARELTR